MDKRKFIDWKDRLSFTQISTYLNCPRQYRFQYRDKAPKGTDAKRILGTCLHSAMAHCLDRQINGNPHVAPRSLEEVRTIGREARRTLLTEWEKLPEGKGKTPIVDLHIMFDRLLNAWLLDIFPRLSPKKVEQPFVATYKGVKLGGYIDLEDEKHGVVDWKVTSSRKEKNLEHSLQLALYAFVSGHEKVGFGSLVKPKGRLERWEPKVHLDTIRLREHAISWAMDVIVDVAQAMNEDKVFARCSPESFLCREEYCDFWSICRGAPVGKPLIIDLSTEKYMAKASASFLASPPITPKATSGWHWLDAIELSAPPEPDWLKPIEGCW